MLFLGSYKNSPHTTHNSIYYLIRRLRISTFANIYYKKTGRL